MSWRYIQVGDQQWEYSTRPTLRCPYDYPRDAGYERQLAPAALIEAATAAGLDAQALLDLAHRRATGIDAGRCMACGSKAVRLGFAARRIRIIGSERLPMHETVERLMFPTRKEAKAWVVEQADVARHASREAATR